MGGSATIPSGKTWTIGEYLILSLSRILTIGDGATLILQDDAILELSTLTTGPSIQCGVGSQIIFKNRAKLRMTGSTVWLPTTCGVLNTTTDISIASILNVVRVVVVVVVVAFLLIFGFVIGRIEWSSYYSNIRTVQYRINKWYCIW
jgi:hypothetical protein